MIMRLISFVLLLTMVAAGQVCVTASAEVVLFDDAPHSNLQNFNSEVSAEQASAGTSSVKMQRGAYAEAGLSKTSTSSGVLIADGNTILEMKLYLASDINTEGQDSKYAGTTIIITTDGTNTQEYYGNSSTGWTVDGNPGHTNLLTLDTWHTLTFDLTAIDGFELGSSSINRVAPKPGPAPGFLAYMDEVKLIPEPGSMALLLSGGLLMFTRKR